MTIPTKATIGALTLGSVGIAGYAASPYFKSENKQEQQPEAKPKISELITSKYEYIPLITKAGEENEDKTHWSTIWNDYKTKSNNVFGFSNWETRETKPLTEELKVKCSNLFNLDVNDDKDPNYQNYTKYCARGVTIADEAGKLKWDVLDTQDSGGKHDAIWTKREAEKKNLQAELKTLEINDDNPDKSKIKAGCKSIVTKNKQDKDYSKILVAYQKVCIKQPTDT